MFVDIVFLMIEPDQEDLLIHFHDWIISHQVVYFLNENFSTITIDEYLSFTCG